MIKISPYLDKRIADFRASVLTLHRLKNVYGELKDGEPLVGGFRYCKSRDRVEPGPFVGPNMEYEPGVVSE